MIDLYYTDGYCVYNALIPEKRLALMNLSLSYPFLGYQAENHVDQSSHSSLWTTMRTVPRNTAGAGSAGLNADPGLLATAR